MGQAFSGPFGFRGYPSPASGEAYGFWEEAHDVFHDLTAEQMFGDADPSLRQVEGLEGILVFLH